MMQLYFLSVIILGSYKVLSDSLVDNNPLIAASWPYVKGAFPYDVQSPIDIKTSEATSKSMKRLKIHCLQNVPDQAVLVENDGHYLGVHLKKNHIHRPWAEGGPLQDDIFLLEQMHFHWGHDDKCGSENHENGKCFSCEIHVVLFNIKYGSYKKAREHRDGLTVIALFGQVSKEDNPKFNDLIAKIPQIIKSETKTTGSFHKQFKIILDILQRQARYYSTPGSLTTKPYLETVTWIFYFNPFDISHRQLSEFRKLKNKDGQNILRNNRPLQPFGRRPLITPC